MTADVAVPYGNDGADVAQGSPDRPILADRLDCNEDSRDVSAEAHHGSRWLGVGEEFPICSIHLSIEVRPREQHCDLHHAVRSSELPAAFRIVSTLRRA